MGEIKKEYRMAKRAIVPVYILLSAELVLLTVIILLISGVFRVSGLIPLIICWAGMLIIMTSAVPSYFKNSHSVMTESEIVNLRGAMIRRREYMPMDAVKSVTQVMMPLGHITGMNFIIINALGSKMVIPFMTYDDCTEAAKFINGIISGREC